MLATTWHGTENEERELLHVAHHYCTCEFGLMGMRLSTCPLHNMLVQDQRALDGLLFARRIADRLRREEGLDDDQSCHAVGPAEVVVVGGE
jgi:hypothetical protein